MNIKYKCEVSGPFYQIPEDQIHKYNKLIGEFFYDSVNNSAYPLLNYHKNIGAIMKVLDKIENMKNKDGEVVYNSSINTNVKQPEYGHNVQLYGSGNHHGAYLQFNVYEAPTKILAIWASIIEFVEAYNYQNGNLPVYGFIKTYM